MLDATQMHNKREEKLSVQISRQQNHSKGRVAEKKTQKILPCERNIKNWQCVFSQIVRTEHHTSTALSQGNVAQTEN